MSSAGFADARLPDPLKHCAGAQHSLYDDEAPDKLQDDQVDDVFLSTKNKIRIVIKNYSSSQPLKLWNVSTRSCQKGSNGRYNNWSDPTRRTRIQ